MYSVSLSANGSQSISANAEQDDPITANLHQFETNLVAFASFSVLVWDHIITFDDEVAYIWKGKKQPSESRKKKPIQYLFILNRYLTPLGFIINFYAYLSPDWTEDRYCYSCLATRCRHFVRYEGSMTIIGISVVALMMLERIRALYFNEPWVWRSVAALFLVMTGINIALMTKGGPVTHSTESGIVACTMIYDWPAPFSAVSAWFPLLYDTYVVILTFNKVYPQIRRKSPRMIWRRLFDDGLTYYSVILAITLILTIMIAIAPPGLKNITAQTELLITVAMMSRITINLRKLAGPEEEERQEGRFTLTTPSHRPQPTMDDSAFPQAYTYTS